jgi:hypothetical protein
MKVMHGGQRLARIVAAMTMTLALVSSPLHANTRVVELTKMLSSSSEKERLSAVAALARLNDRTTVKPLVAALTDPNPRVRALAATALGRLGHKAALPALKTAADDADPTVRARAKEAAITVAKLNHLPHPWPSSHPANPAALAPIPAIVAALPATPVRKHGGRAGFGRQAHAVESRPDLYVMINSAADDSPGKADKKARKAHGEILRQTLTSSFKASPLVTTLAADAQRWGLDPRHVDLSVTKLDVVHAGNYVEIDAQLRLAISDSKGKMLSFLSGGAKVQVPRKTFDARYLPNLRKEALENAMRGMFDKLLAQLRVKTHS